MTFVGLSLLFTVGSLSHDYGCHNHAPHDNFALIFVGLQIRAKTGYDDKSET